MRVSTFQLLNPFGKPVLSDVTCHRATFEEMVLWYLRVHAWFLGALVAADLITLATRSFRRPLHPSQQVDESLGPSASDGQHPINGPEIQPRQSRPGLDQLGFRSEMQTPGPRHNSKRQSPVQASVSQPRHPNWITAGGRISRSCKILPRTNSERSSARNRASFRESQSFVPMYELDDTGVRRRHQGPVILRGIRGGAGDEVQNEFQNECPQTTEEPNPRDDRDAEEYSGNMSEYLELEDLLEATRNDFDERQSHCDGSLLREALVLNERIRLRRDYRELKECLDQQIRILGLEPEELDAEEMHRPGRSGISAGRNEMYAGRPPPWRRRRARSQRPVQSLDQ